MAVKLIERLCFATGESPPPEEAPIPTALMCAVLRKIRRGRHTRAQAKDFFNMPADGGGSTQRANFDTLCDNTIGINDDKPIADALQDIDDLCDTLYFWALRDDFPLTPYDTLDEIQTELLAIS